MSERRRESGLVQRRPLYQSIKARLLETKPQAADAREEVKNRWPTHANTCESILIFLFEPNTRSKRLGGPLGRSGYRYSLPCNIRRTITPGQEFS